jgi:hypothetical protein
MDTSAHRTIKHARDTLVDGLRLGLCDLGHRPDDPFAHGLSLDQARKLDHLVWQLFDLMDNDPQPPECQTCATPLDQQPTGRPRRFCSDACRQQDARIRRQDAESDAR